jgi:hypothetical protein
MLCLVHYGPQLKCSPAYAESSTPTALKFQHHLHGRYRSADFPTEIDLPHSHKYPPGDTLISRNHSGWRVWPCRSAARQGDSDASYTANSSSDAADSYARWLLVSARLPPLPTIGPVHEQSGIQGVIDTTLTISTNCVEVGESLVQLRINSCSVCHAEPGVPFGPSISWASRCRDPSLRLRPRSG